MKQATARLPFELIRELDRAGIDAAFLLRNCRELILCGSRTVRGRKDSDWDIVAIGHDIPRRKRGLIDLIPIDQDSVLSPQWVESELASHIKYHGVWLKGEPGPWVAKVAITSKTLSTKAQRLRYRLNLMERSWELLSPVARSRYLKLLRRDLQRFNLLAHGAPVPPSPILDADWEISSNRLGEKGYLEALLPRLPDDLQQNVREWIAHVQFHVS